MSHACRVPVLYWRMAVPQLRRQRYPGEVRRVELCPACGRTQVVTGPGLLDFDAIARLHLRLARREADAARQNFRIRKDTHND